MRATLLVVTNLLATIAVALAQGVSLTRQQSALLLLKASLESNETVQALNSWNPQTDVCSSWQGVQCNGQGIVTALKLSNVGLRGQLPFSDSVWSALPELKTVDLGNNFIGGYLPPNIGTLNNLESLNLSGNQFNGVLPPGWGSLSKLQNLDLGNNYLGGSLPPQWSSLTNLQTLNLGTQRRGGFTGGVPSQWRQTQGGNTTGLTSLQNLNVQVAGANCFGPNFKPPPNFVCGAPGQPSLQSPPPPAPIAAQPTAPVGRPTLAPTAKQPATPTATPAASQTAAPTAKQSVAPIAKQTAAPTAKQTAAPTAKQTGVAATKAPTPRVTAAPTRAAAGILLPLPIAQRPALAPSIAVGPGVATAPALGPASKLAPGPGPSLTPAVAAGPSLTPGMAQGPGLAPSLVSGAGVGPAPSVGPGLAPNVGPSAAVRNTSGVAVATPVQTTPAPTASAATALQTTFGVTGLTPSQFTSVKDQFQQIVSDAAQTPAGSTIVQSVTAGANARRLLLFRRELLQTQNSLSITSLTQTNDPAAAARNIQAAIADGSLPQKLRALGLAYVPGSFTNLPTNVRQSSSGSSNGKRLAKIIVPSIVGGLIIIALLLCCCLFCLARNKKRKERSTVGRVQPSKEYPVSDTSGYKAPPGEDIDDSGGTRDVAPAVAATGAGLAAVGLASGGAAGSRAVDTSHPKVYVAPTVNEPFNKFANEPFNKFSNEPANKFANEPVNEPIFFKPTDANAFDDRVIERGDRHEILKDHPIVREGDYHVYPASSSEPLLVPTSRAVSDRGTGRSIAAPLAAGTAAVAAGVGVAAAHGRQHSDSVESDRSSFESAQDTDPPGRAGIGFGGAAYASSFATAKPAVPVVAESVGPSAAGRSFATATPYTQSSAGPGYPESFATCTPQVDPVTSRQADSFATARQAAGSAIPGTAYAESFATAKPANQSIGPTTAAPSFMTAVPQGSTRPTTEYAETFNTAAPGTTTQVGRRSTEYPETYVTAMPATPQQAGAAGPGRELAESFTTAAQGAPTVASREPDDFLTSPQSLQSRGPMVAAAAGAAATIGAAATYAMQHESDRPQEIALARQSQPPMSSGQDYVPLSGMESSSRNEPKLATPGEPFGQPSEPTSSSTNTSDSSSGLEGAYDIGKGGAGGSRATATRGIVGVAGKMKYFSTRKSSPVSRSPPPAGSSLPSEAYSAEAPGASGAFSPFAVNPGMTRRGSRGSFDSAEGSPLPGLASRREDLPADYATHSFSTAKEARASDFVSESASSRRAPTSTDPPGAFASTSFSTAKEPNPSELLSLATSEGVSNPTTGQSYILGGAKPAASADVQQARAEPEPLRAPAIITPRTGHVAERASLFGGQSRVDSPPPAGTSTGGVMPQSARLGSMAPDLDLDRYASAQSNMTFQSATSQALQSESSLPMPRQGSILGPGAAAALAGRGTPPDSGRWSGFDTSRSGWETARSRAESLMPASARGGMASGRGVSSGSPAPAETGGFDTARSGIGGTPRSAFSGNTPRQYSYRSNASGDDVTGETPRDRIGLGGDLSAHAMPGDTGATLSPRPVQFTDSDDSSSNSSERQPTCRNHP